MIRLYYEARFGLARGAICVDGIPHLYLEGLEADSALNLLGVTSVARLKSRSGGMAFIALADGHDAVLDAPQEALARLSEGAAIEIEIIAEARSEKLARARLIGTAEGEPRRLSPLLSVKDRLQAQARTCFGDAAIDGAEDETDLLDEARDTALNPSGPLPEGGHLSVERTRALIACDVDAAGGEGMATPKAFAKACNERAVQDIARRLRLSGLAGLVVIDLIGRRHDAAKLHTQLLKGCGPEAGRIITGPMGKFGTLEFVRPWGACPLMDTVKSPLNQAYSLLRQAAKLAEADPGRLLALRAPVSVIDQIRPLLAASYDPLAAIIRPEAASKSEVVSL
ncbi:MAG: ribonuclease E/G [Asticcacaulis sp.]